MHVTLNEHAFNESSVFIEHPIHPILHVRLFGLLLICKAYGKFNTVCIQLFLQGCFRSLFSIVAVTSLIEQSIDVL